MHGPDSRPLADMRSSAPVAAANSLGSLSPPPPAPCLLPQLCSGEMRVLGVAVLCCWRAPSSCLAPASPFPHLPWLSETVLCFVPALPLLGSLPPCLLFPASSVSVALSLYALSTFLFLLFFLSLSSILRISFFLCSSSSRPSPFCTPQPWNSRHHPCSAFNGRSPLHRPHHFFHASPTASNGGLPPARPPSHAVAFPAKGSPLGPFCHFPVPLLSHRPLTEHARTHNHKTHNHHCTQRKPHTRALSLFTSSRACDRCDNLGADEGQRLVPR